MKIHLIAIIRAKEEYQEEVSSILKNLVKQTREEEACELYTLHQGLDDKNLFTFYEIWKNQAGLDAHNEQPYIKAIEDLTKGKLQEKPEILITTLI